MSENVLTKDLRSGWGHLDIEFEDYYSHTKVTGDDVDRFVNSFTEDAKAQDVRVGIKWHDHDEVSVKYTDSNP